MKTIWEPADVIRGRKVTLLGGYETIITKSTGPESAAIWALVTIADGSMSYQLDRESMARHLTCIGAVP